MAHTILRLREVLRVTGLGRSTIYRKLTDDSDDFPEPIKLGPRTVGWISEEIQDWLEQRIKDSRSCSRKASVGPVLETENE